MSHHVSTTWYGLGTKRGFCTRTASSHQTPTKKTKLLTARVSGAGPGMACLGVRYVRIKPRRRRGLAADGAGAIRAAGTRLNWSPLQRVDEVGVHRVRWLHRGVDLSLRLPEITCGLDVVIDLARGALGAHDLLALLQVEQRERVQVCLHIVRALGSGFGHDAQGLRRVLLEPVEGVVVGLHELLDGGRVLVDEVLPERKAVHDQ